MTTAKKRPTFFWRHVGLVDNELPKSLSIQHRRIILLTSSRGAKTYRNTWPFVTRRQATHHRLRWMITSNNNFRNDLVRFSTVAERCKPTLQNLKHFYKAWDKFTFWKTFLHIIKQNYITITHLQVPKQIYISENKLTRRKTLLQVPIQIYKWRNKFTNDINRKGNVPTPWLTWKWS